MTSFPQGHFCEKCQKRGTEKKGTSTVLNLAFYLKLRKNKFSSQHSTINHNTAWRNPQVKGAFLVLLAKISRRNNL